LAFGGFLDQLHSFAGEPDRGTCHRHGEELAKRSSTFRPLAPMLAPATAGTLSECGEELRNDTSSMLALLLALALAYLLSGPPGGEG
jgi:hypothetical protein